MRCAHQGREGHRFVDAIYLRIRLIKKSKVIWRCVQLLLHLIAGIILAALFLRRNPANHSTSAGFSLWWHTRLRKIFGVQHEQFGDINRTPTLFVANHISWFDIPATGSILLIHFLAKDEIASWPVIGWLAHKTGTLFIQRGNRDATRQSIENIAQVLKNGRHVLVFPEGTTNDGTKVGHFHSRLLQAAFDAQVVVQPLAITYPHADGIHPHAPYVGHVRLIDSALGFMASDDVTVCLHFLPVLEPKNFANRDALTAEARQMIAAVVETLPVSE
ncbi:MAG: lyso-ornithine lipid O-acyltransferase [Pseudomonadota bacterium]|nr:lyso-ornithine lipid O-acyltransferase [Pseudomonadota bacterium]